MAYNELIIVSYFPQAFTAINQFCKWIRNRCLCSLKCVQTNGTILQWFYIDISTGSLALSAQAVEPRITPNISDLSYVLKIKDVRIEVPLSEPERLWSLSEFDRKLPLVMMITGWTTDADNSYNPALDSIYAAYRCRGNVNFVTVDTGEFLVLQYLRFIYIFQIWISIQFLFVFLGKFLQTLYSWSAFNTEAIGAAIAESLRILTQNYPIENIHLIGKCSQCHNSWWCIDLLQ